MIKRVEKVTNKITLYNCDCMEFMKGVSDNYYDLAIVDPPYFKGVANGSYFGGKVSKTGVKRLCSKSDNWDSNIPNINYYNELVRVSKNQIIWGINYFNFGVTGGCIIWDKKNNSSTFSNCEIASNSLINGVFIYRELWNGMLKTENSKRIHPTQKPVKLYEWLLKNYAKPTDKILDTHFGSCSIGIACHNFGCSLDACELDEEYFDNAFKRVRTHVRQLDLFK